MMGFTVFLLPVVAIVAVFTFVAVASWSDNRRKEREEYYRHETYRKMLEHGDSAQAVLDLMRSEQLQQARRRVDGLRLGGLVTMAAGAGLMIFLGVFRPTEGGIYLVGIIPLLIGFVLAVYGFFVAPRSIEHPTTTGGNEPLR